MTATAAPTRTREEIAEKDKWNLEIMYDSEDRFDADLKKAEAMAKDLEKEKGKLNSAAALSAFLKRQDALDRLATKLMVYAMQRADEDTGNATHQGRKSRAMAKVTELQSTLAWVRPELLAKPTEELEKWRDSAELKEYRYSVVVLLRQKAHTLSAAEEELLARAGEIFRAPYETYSLLRDADMTFPPAVDGDGKEHELTNGKYIMLMERPDRKLRQSAFEKLYDTYGSYKNTIAKNLSSAIKVDNFIAKSRNFPSALVASLHEDNIPLSLVESLYKATDAALPAFYEYVDLRAEVLKISDLNMWDMYVPIVPDFEMEVSYEEGVQWVKEAMQPMGAEYMAAVEECFASRWVDVYENKGKRGGAYSGGCYDSPPYMLLNYQNTLDNVFTLAHELGHSMHTWFAKKYQPSRYAEYTIFVAEIASTTAEALLLDYLLKKLKDKKAQAFLYNHLCDSFRGTVYRQSMFSQFERIIHEADQNGTALTAEWISESYYDLNAKFFGPAVKADKRISQEWSRIPHFYYNFYVYKYATGFCASQLFSRQILSGEKGRDQYLEMLKAGGSMDSLDVVKLGGVDLANPAVLENAFSNFRDAVKGLRELLKG